MSFQYSSGQSYVKGDFAPLEKLIATLKEPHHLDIGIFASAKTGDGKQIAEYGVAHEFGAHIQHPGGTPYIVTAHGARFVRKGTANPTGVTRPHIIPMPARSFIRMPLMQRGEMIKKHVQKHLREHLEQGDVKAILDDIGIAGETAIQEAFETGGFGKWKPLSPRTVKRKGSSAILIDKGLMRQAIDHRIDT